MTEKKEKLLPIGSVITLKEGNVPLMIFGRMQVASESSKAWDYVAVLYPEGVISAEQMYFFDRDQVDELYFIGFQTQQEVMLQDWLERQAAGEDVGPWSPDNYK